MKNKITHLAGTCVVAFAALLSFTQFGHAADKTLRIIGWEGYMDPSFTAEFTRRTGYKIVPTYCGSSDEMYAKIKAGGGSSYDLVTASGDLTRKLFDAGLLQPIDLAKVPNYDKLFPLFKSPPYNTFDGKNYGISIAWGPDLLIYDPEQVTDAEAGTWMSFFDPKFKGKISINDYSIFLADIKLWFYGPENIFAIDEQELQTKIKPKLMPLRPQIRKFWTSQGELTQLFSGKEIAMAWGWPVTVVQLKKDGFPVKATVPKEGTTGWSDSWMIIKGSPNSAIAQEWMNYMLEGEAQKKLVAASGYWPVSSAIVPLLSKAERADLHIDDLDTYFKTIHFWETVPNLDQWNALWNEFKAQ
ncbi:MAG: extracellular solute-binding protein [Terrimicrobiaceae bacterium]|nr:extracellular solute-binding protein [Terrimicrobiaceae bacterium]